MRVRALVASLVVCLVIPAAAFAQSGTIDFGDGPLEIEAYSFGVGAELATDSGGGAARTARVKFGELQFTKKVDKSSPKLFESCANGTHYPQVTLLARKAGKVQQEFLIVKMTDVLVTSVLVSGGVGNPSEIPTESLSLNYSKIEFSVR